MFLRPVNALLLLLLVAGGGCSKSKSGPSYTAKMGSTRHWHGSHYYVASGLHFPTPINESYYYPDTSFALTIRDGSTVLMGADTFKYDRTDATLQIYYFGTAYYYYQYNVGTGIAYYYAKDSIVYCNGDLHATDDYWELQDLYYTY